MQSMHDFIRSAHYILVAVRCDPLPLSSYLNELVFKQNFILIFAITISFFVIIQICHLSYEVLHSTFTFNIKNYPKKPETINNSESNNLDHPIWLTDHLQIICHFKCEESLFLSEMLHRSQ